MGLLVNPHGKKVSVKLYFVHARLQVEPQCLLKLVDVAAFCTIRVELKVKEFDSMVSACKLCVLKLLVFNLCLVSSHGNSCSNT